MFTKKMFAATILGGIGMWGLAGIWHELVMATFYSEAMEATHEGTGIILLAYLVLAVLMAYLYPLVNQGNTPWKEGLRFGVIIGVPWVFPHELAMAGAHGNPISYVLKNGLWHMVEQGVGGMIIASIYART